MHLKPTLWGDYSNKLMSFLGSKVNMEATIGGLHPLFLFQKLLTKRAYFTMGPVTTYQLVTGQIIGKSKIFLLGWYSCSEENFIFISGFIDNKLDRVAKDC
jgi:hypothetical protein